MERPIWIMRPTSSMKTTYASNSLLSLLHTQLAHSSYPHPAHFSTSKTTIIITIFHQHLTLLSSTRFPPVYDSFHFSQHASVQNPAHTYKHLPPTRSPSPSIHAHTLDSTVPESYSNCYFPYHKTIPSAPSTKMPPHSTFSCDPNGCFAHIHFMLVNATFYACHGIPDQNEPGQPRIRPTCMCLFLSYHNPSTHHKISTSTSPRSTPSYRTSNEAFKRNSQDRFHVTTRKHHSSRSSPNQEPVLIESK